MDTSALMSKRWVHLTWPGESHLSELVTDAFGWEWSGSVGNSSSSGQESDATRESKGRSVEEKLHKVCQEKLHKASVASAFRVNNEWSYLIRVKDFSSLWDKSPFLTCKKRPCFNQHLWITSGSCFALFVWGLKLTYLLSYGPFRTSISQNKK